jgi:hypothetical protein
MRPKDDMDAPCPKIRAVSCAKFTPMAINPTYFTCAHVCWRGRLTIDIVIYSNCLEWRFPHCSVSSFWGRPVKTQQKKVSVVTSRPAPFASPPAGCTAPHSTKLQCGPRPFQNPSSIRQPIMHQAYSVSSVRPQPQPYRKVQDCRTAGLQ